MTADEFNKKVRAEAANELRAKVQAALPELFEAYHDGIGTTLSAAMHILETDCNGTATKNLAMIVEIRDDMSVDEYIRQIKGGASMLGQQVRFLCGEMANIPHGKDDRLYWLQNWPLTLIDSPVYDDKSFVIKMSIRGGWVWLSEQERNFVLQGGQIARLSEATV